MTKPKIQIKEDIISRMVGGKGILLDPETDEMRHLNDAASFLWARLLEAPLSADELLAAFLDEFEVEDEAIARADVEAFLATLSARGFT